MPDLLIIALMAVAAALGLLGAKLLWSLRLAHRRHNPTCPNRLDVLERAKSVRIDIDEITSRKGLPQ